MRSARAGAWRSVTNGRTVSIALGAGLCLAGLLACRPALDWREVHRPGDRITMLMPCRPETQQRIVALGQWRLPMRLESCTAADLGFALAVLEAPDGVEPAMLREALRRQMIANVNGVARKRGSLPGVGVAGSAPLTWRIAGRLPDGRAVLEDTVDFSHATRLYQATVVSGPEADAAQRTAAADTFFASLRVH